VLKLNVTVLNGLAREAAKRQSVEGPAAAPRYAVFSKVVGGCLDDHAFINSHVSLVRERAERISTIVSVQAPSWYPIYPICCAFCFNIWLASRPVLYPAA
jgi:hypothetical protein